MTEKNDAIKKFSFMTEVYNRVKNSGFFKDDKEIDMCGVFFYEKYAYTTNNHIMGRLTIDDNQPIDEFLFWSYTNNDILKFDKEFLLNLKNCQKINSMSCNLFKESFAENLNYIFNRYTENYLYIQKNSWLDMIDSIAERDAIKAKSFLCVTVDENLYLRVCITNNKGRIIENVRILDSYIYPSERVRLRIGSTFSVNVYYFYKIVLHSFDEYDIIGIRFRHGDLNAPVVIFGKNSSKPEICWALAQTKVQKNSEV